MSSYPIWLDALFDPSIYPHPVSKVELIETHISWVILTGDWTYKLKKPVNLGFVDFSTLELRHAACREELRLNRRTAPDLYDSVVRITKEDDRLTFDGTGPVLEYAVRMRQFRQSDVLDQCLQRNELTDELVERLADEVARLHLGADTASPDTPFGKPDLIRATVEQCLTVLSKAPLPEESQRQLSLLNQWIDSEWKRLRETFISRRERGWVRECHGDLHLGNLVLIEGQPTLFDCLEFNPGLRWIDVFSDIGFLVMDLLDRKAAPLAWRVFNQWLERTGDFEGLSVLRFYLAYRALVRAKVAAIRLQQSGLSPVAKAQQEKLLGSYIEQAAKSTERPAPGLLLMHGVSGSGKTHLARELAAHLAAIRIRSDVERKRPWTNWPAETAQLPPADVLYSDEINRQTYQRLQSLTKAIVDAGYSVIVDGAFLKVEDRRTFEILAGHLRIPFAIVSCRASERVLFDRVNQRTQEGKDASDATTDVLRQQLRSSLPLAPSEKPFVVEVDTSHLDLSETVRSIQKTLTRAAAKAH